MSTVSRAISDKYAQTPQGIVPLKFFFTGGTESEDGGVESRQSVKERVRQIIEAEEKHRPLSDDEVAERLNQEFGLSIARRTVTKYRKALGIAVLAPAPCLVVADRGSRTVTRTLRLDLSFDGTDFLGWQRQPRGRTVQGEVEAALDRILGAPHRVIGAGRHRHRGPRRRDGRVLPDRGIDGGARARAGARRRAPCRTWACSTCREAPEGFHALRDARWKWYRYSVLNAPRRRPLERRRTWQVRPGRLDRAVLDAGAAALGGHARLPGVREPGLSPAVHGAHAATGSGGPARWETAWSSTSSETDSSTGWCARSWAPWSTGRAAPRTSRPAGRGRVQAGGAAGAARYPARQRSTGPPPDPWRPPGASA